MFQNTIKNLEQMPDFLTGNDLIKLGLYKNWNTLYLARRHGQAPDYIQIRRKILYSRDSVIAFIRSRIKLGSAATLTTGKSSE